jgi:hypothetical protein
MGHGPPEVAGWTPLQQLAVLNPRKFADSLWFRTEEEYARWLTSRQ